MANISQTLYDFCMEHENKRYLLEEWDYERNEVTPNKIRKSNTNKFWWICKKGHSYSMQIGNRIYSNQSCPICSNRRILEGYNDLKHLYPILLKEWDFEKNNMLSIYPNQVGVGSIKKVWWKCKKGHSYFQAIKNKVNGSQCPYCDSHKVLKGFNDLATKFPELLNEWDYKKNDKRPDEVMPFSHYKAWWICPFGHSYQAHLSSRTGSSHSGCNICSKENRTSFPEQAIYFYLKKKFPDTINSDVLSIDKELDIYVPSYKIAIEYDGFTYHKDKYAKDFEKNVLCKNNNIFLIRVREKGLKLYDNCCCIVREDIKTDKGLEDVLIKLFNMIKKITKCDFHLDINIERDVGLIYTNYIKNKKNNSLKMLYPKIANEWDYSKNGDLKPEMVSPKSKKKVWWLCPNGHHYLLPIVYRTMNNNGCHYCSSHKILHGFNDLETWCQNNNKLDILKDWYYERNDVNPYDVFPQSNKKVWWKCHKCGNIYQSSVYKRIIRKSECIECKKKEKEGEISISKKGMKMRLLKYYNSSNVTVEFEDGLIVYHKEYRAFKDGNIGRN